MRTTKKTKGGTALAEALKPKLTAKGLADELGVSQQSVSNWVTGRAKPSLELMIRIRDLTGVPLEAWNETADEPPEAA